LTELLRDLAKLEVDDLTKCLNTFTAKMADLAISDTTDDIDQTPLKMLIQGFLL
jgi:hypothetical protein